jgi:predicted nucleic acid-binding protein
MLLVVHAVKGKQVHDARLVAMMEAHGITHILTLNGADFARYPGIVVIDPAGVIPPSPSTP